MPSWIHRLLLAAMLLLPSIAMAQYPDRPIRLVVPFGVSGVTTDVLARRVAERLQAILGRPVVVENRAGGGGVLGTDMVAKSRPDGYTLLLTSPSGITLGPVLRSVPYDPMTGLEHVIQLTTSPFTVIVNKDIAAGTLADFLQLARARPGVMNFISLGVGTLNHVCFEQIAHAAGDVDLLHVPYRDGTVESLLRGDAHSFCLSISVALPLIRDGLVRALAVTSQDRWHQLPDVPTLRELGLAIPPLGSWSGIAVPAGTPPEIVGRLRAALLEVMEDPAIRRFADDNAMIPTALTGEALARFLREESQSYGALARAVGIRLD